MSTVYECIHKNIHGSFDIWQGFENVSTIILLNKDNAQDEPAFYQIQLYNKIEFFQNISNT